MRAGSDTVSYLYRLQYRGMKFGLRNMRTLLRSVGNPERRFPSIHVAGTNGKGSTSAFLASMFAEAGYSTGLYTSPHLVRFTERVKINGREIPEERVRSYVARLKPSIEAVQATFFEATTCVAFLYFADEGVDLAVIETGLGGRLDATNVVVPLVSVITSIALDHTEYLGHTAESISREKGGIIKEGVPLVTAVEETDALNVLRRIASKRRARVIQARDAVTVRRLERGKGLVLRSARLGRVKARPGFAGTFQEENARLAAAVADTLLGNRGFRMKFAAFGAAAVERGLARVIVNTGLRGRLERAGRRGEFRLDVAHNPAGIHALVSALKGKRGRPAAALFGVMKDKDFAAMLEELSGFVSRIIPVAPRMKRALSSHRLGREAKRLGFEVLRGGTVKEGLRTARRFLTQREFPQKGGSYILVTGSHYVVGEVSAELDRRKSP